MTALVQQLDFEQDHTWHEQWRRMLRSHEAMSAALTASNTLIVTELFDATAHFFMDCWHMKDWLVNSPHPDDPRPLKWDADLRPYISGSEALAIAADVANGEKHVSPDRRPWTGDSGAGVRTGGGSGPTSSIERWLFIDVHGFRHDARACANDAIDDWRRFLDRVGFAEPAAP